MEFQKQKQVWENEHLKIDALPSMNSESPANGVLLFCDFLKSIHSTLVGLSGIEIGCGKGRNAIYMAKQGIKKLFAMDYIQYALDEAGKRARLENVEPYFVLGDMGNDWPFVDEMFDFVIDCYASIDIETFEKRIKCRDEMHRTMKNNGHAVIVVVSNKDDMESQFISSSPASEPNSCIWPNGKFQKDYSDTELIEFYSTRFTVLELKTISKESFKLGQRFQSLVYCLIIKKEQKEQKELECQQ